jgi:hypothetical protein
MPSIELQLFPEPLNYLHEVVTVSTSLADESQGQYVGM